MRQARWLIEFDTSERAEVAIPAGECRISGLAVLSCVRTITGRDQPGRYRGDVPAELGTRPRVRENEDFRRRGRSRREHPDRARDVVADHQSRGSERLVGIRAELRTSAVLIETEGRTRGIHECDGPTHVAGHAQLV